MQLRIDRDIHGFFSGWENNDIVSDLLALIWSHLRVNSLNGCWTLTLLSIGKFWFFGLPNKVCSSMIFAIVSHAYFVKSYLYIVGLPMVWWVFWLLEIKIIINDPIPFNILNLIWNHECIIIPCLPGVVLSKLQSYVVETIDLWVFFLEISIYSRIDKKKYLVCV